MSRFDELVDRIGSDPSIGIRAARTKTGAVLDNGRIRIELRGSDEDFDAFVRPLARDAKQAMGSSDGLGLYIVNLQEDLDTLEESMVYELRKRRVVSRPLLSKE